MHFSFVLLASVSLVAATPFRNAQLRQRAPSRPRDVSNGTACAAVSSTVSALRAATPSATPTIPAQLAYDCITSVPLNASAATDLIDSLLPYLQWQSTTSYLKSPPAEYVEKIQQPVDVYGGLAAIRNNVTTGAYENGKFQHPISLRR